MLRRCEEQSTNRHLGIFFAWQGVESVNRYLPVLSVFPNIMCSPSSRNQFAPYRVEYVDQMGRDLDEM